MKIVSWNVNGLRSVIGYSPWCHAKKHERLHTMLEYFNSDIICFQETKITRDQLSTNLSTVKGYITFYSFCNVKSGYCGVSTHIRESQTHLRPIKAQDGFTGLLKSNDSHSLITSNELLNKLREQFSDNRLKQLDNEGRCLITEHNNFLLFNIYFPNGNGSEDRLYFKTDYHSCIKIVIEYFINYKHKNVILLGDMNAKYQMIDSCDPGLPQDFYDRQSTQWFKYLINDIQMIDTFKYIHSDFTKLDKKPYTCWDQYTFARSSNYGTRIDYILVNKQMICHMNNEKDITNKEKLEEKNNIKIFDAKVMQSVMGSDHCPVLCQIIGIDKQWNKNKQISIPKLASRFMPEFAGKQTNLMSFFSNKSKNSNNIKSKTNSRKRKFEEIVTNNINTNANINATKKQKLNNNITKSKPKITKNNSKSNKSQANLLHFMKKSNQSNTNKPKQNNTNTNKSHSCPDLTNKIKAISTNTKPSIPRQSSAEQWKSLFGKKKKNPLCHHGEETILRTVTKTGVNKGKKFYVCTRGKGAVNDPNAQCKFFQWFDKPVKLKSTNSKNRKFKSW